MKEKILKEMFYGKIMGKDVSSQTKMEKIKLCVHLGIRNPCFPFTSTGKSKINYKKNSNSEARKVHLITDER